MSAPAGFAVGLAAGCAFVAPGSGGTAHSRHPERGPEGSTLNRSQSEEASRTSTSWPEDREVEQGAEPILATPVKGSVSRPLTSITEDLRQ